MSASARAVTRLYVRLTRRGGLLMALAAGVYLVTELASYGVTYPDAASRARLASFQDNPAVRMVQGIPHAVDLPGGFVAWDAGWVIASVLGVWAVLTTARLLRGEEEADRVGMVLAGPVSAGRVIRSQLLVVGGGIGLIALSAFAVLAGWGTGVAGSALFCLGLAGFTATFAGLAAVAAQLFQARRRVVGAATAALGVFFVLRMVANSADSRGWVRWLTPFGWMDELHAYRGGRWAVLALLLGVPAALAGVALALRSRRDTGGALLAEPDQHRPHLRLLGSPLAFAWRSGRGMLIGWLLGLAGYAFVIGAVLKAVVDFLANDPGYQSMLKLLGVDVSKITQSLVAVMAVILGLGIALYGCWRLGAARTEESTERAENLLTRPVPRWRWLGGHTALALLGAVLLVVTNGLAMWAGAAMTGGDLTAPDALRAMLNTLPLAVLFGGLAVLVFGVAPRLTVALSVSVAVTGYLLEVLGPALKWPGWVLDVSPFHHLAAVPAEPFAPLPAAVLAGLGLAAALAGLAAFERRDLAGA